jgi:hypothetical protein
VLEASVAWADRTGQAGCHIEQVTHGREQFTEWLSNLFHEVTGMIPAVVQGYEYERCAPDATR